VKIFIADDHSIVRAGMIHLLTALGYEIVGEANDIAELAENIPASGADILLTDYDMPKGELISTLREIRAQQPNLKIVVLTGLKHVAMFKSIMESSARINGLLMKSMKPAELKQAIECVTKGKRYIQPDILQLIEDNSFSLTNRESQVLEILVAGKSNGEIAQLLNISVRTVDNHRINLMKKLKVRNLAQLIKTATDAGLI